MDDAVAGLQKITTLLHKSTMLPPCNPFHKTEKEGGNITMLKRALGAIAIVVLPLTAMATEYTVVERPRQECWNEQVATNNRSSNITGAVIGGVAGGILGNQVGDGNGKTVATAVGAATGAVVGDRMSNNSPSTQTVQRCRTVMERHRVPVAERVVHTERVYYVKEEKHKHKKHKKHKHHPHDHHHDHDD
jgi:uncharacterized protein YcfJ